MQEIPIQHLAEQHPEVDGILDILVAPKIEFIGDLQVDERYKKPDIIKHLSFLNFISTFGMILSSSAIRTTKPLRSVEQISLASSKFRK